MLATAAASVGVALANERTLAPVFAEAAPYNQPVAIAPPPVLRITWLGIAREFIARRVLTALAIGAAGVILAASVPAMTAVASTLRAGTAGDAPSHVALADLRGSPHSERALADAGDPGTPAFLYRSQQQIELEQSLVALAAYRDWLAATTPASSTPARAVAAPAAAPFSLNAASGFAPGTKLRARITIYGCYGPGGGFCHHMSAGGTPFPGAVACSDNLPFGTKLRITGDPTGRTYECLDRGRLTPTWIDVYFDDTTEGMAWQSSLGTTITDIEIVN
jgi:hypothetical protein